MIKNLIPELKKIEMEDLYINTPLNNVNAK